MYCSNCGTQIAEDANFCSKCGESQTPHIQAEELKWETCEIVWEEVSASFGGLGRITGYFWAKAIGPNGVYESGRTQFFKIKGVWSPDSTYKEDVAVHNALISQLVKDGWEPTTERGSTWWSHKFRRKAMARPSETKDIFDLVIIDAGPNKIETIKVIRILLSLGLKDAKKLSETPNGVILMGVSKSTALQAQSLFQKAGAAVKIV